MYFVLILSIASIGKRTTSGPKFGAACRGENGSARCVM